MTFNGKIYEYPIEGVTARPQKFFTTTRNASNVSRVEKDNSGNEASKLTKKKPESLGYLK